MGGEREERDNLGLHGAIFLNINIIMQFDACLCFGVPRQDHLAISFIFRKMKCVHGMTREEAF